MNYSGVDVSAQELVVRVRRPERGEERRWFDNTPAGRKARLSYLLGRGREPIRVCLEASGNYSLDVALALAGRGAIALEVINPKAARRFAEALDQRSQNDPVDAEVLLEYALRMPFTRWQPRGSGICRCAPSPGNFRPSPKTGPLGAAACMPPGFRTARPLCRPRAGPSHCPVATQPGTVDARRPGSAKPGSGAAASLPVAGQPQRDWASHRPGGAGRAGGDRGPIATTVDQTRRPGCGRISLGYFGTQTAPYQSCR